MRKSVPWRLSTLRRVSSDAGGAGGYWQEWERQAADRRALWEEAHQRRKAEDAWRDAEWARMRASWAEGASQRQQTEDKSRFTWWWEDAVKGQRRATPEQAREWQVRAALATHV